GPLGQQITPLTVGTDIGHHILTWVDANQPAKEFIGNSPPLQSCIEIMALQVGPISGDLDGDLRSGGCDMQDRPSIVDTEQIGLLGHVDESRALSCRSVDSFATHQPSQAKARGRYSIQLI